MKNVMLIVSCLMVFTMVANADTILLMDGQNGYNGNETTGLMSHIPTSNNGAVDYDYINLGGTYRARTLYRWDVSSLAGATINSVTLTLVAWARGEPDPVGGIDVHEMLPANSGWTEMGTSWNNLNQSTLTAWAGSAGASTPGVDYAATPIANFGDLDNSAPGAYSFPSPVAIPISLVQGWVDNAANNAGFMLKLHDESQVTSTTMLSNEFGGANHTFHPSLTIDYTPVPEPMTMALLGLGGLFIRRKK